ncbi:hypothetical protein LQG66_18045 [Bradyrhizobium ontarionense]|uniref:Uncharacterized protein n=1 Tax=Bradyrhizobium ontarionense TaxID=2898149 RepID=A0ABY3RLY2_9BRAD|nr:hypothetical protein [Bradyrhizobium sp. A19]UFZ08072.1 hypothetical protein LQG66_18045 [Bradyrhizobium sp. A19]
MGWKQNALRAAVWGLAFAAPAGPARAEQVTECTRGGFCYCVNAELRGAIQQNIADIRAMIAAERAKGKAIGYLSIPISTVAGSYFGENVKIAAEIKERVEDRLGVHAAWLLNTAGTTVTLPPGAAGADYMLMWTNVLEGSSGLGDFDFVYFAGPSDFARHFAFDGKADLEKLEAFYDAAVKTDPELKKVDRRAFRDYYGLRASVAYSYGSHDEWDIVRAINEKRVAASNFGIARQIAVLFDAMPAAPGLFETGVAAGNAGACKG